MILSFQQQQVDSNVGALKNEIAQLRRLVADLRGELGEVLTRQNDIERTFEEQLNCHREDLDWDREECILLRTGLQENKDRIDELSIRGQQMARQLCRCADRQGPPISAVGSPQPPPYARTPSSGVSNSSSRVHASCGHSSISPFSNCFACSSANLPISYSLPGPREHSPIMLCQPFDH